jgi:hypothetical protein
VKGVSGRTYGWQVPAIKGNKSTCKVRVKAFDTLGKGAGTDASDSAFTIEVLELDTPNGGEAVSSNTTAAIQWTTHATAKPVAKVKLQYSITGGGGWKTIATIDGNPGSYDWTVPLVTSSQPQSKIRITLTDSAGGKLAKDESDACSRSVLSS